MKEKFKVAFLEEVFEFLDDLDAKTRSKIFANIDKAKVTASSTIFKKLNADIWEFRIVYNKKQYRLLAFWDKSDNKITIVVATHGIIKKTQKMPTKEIDKATALMKKYFEEKNK